MGFRELRGAAMGALTSNRKRGDDCLSSSYTSSSPHSQGFGCGTDLHISKKPRSLPMRFSPEPPVYSRNPVSRIRQYPEQFPGLRREVHAPRRKPKFGNSASGVGESRPETYRVSEKPVSIDEMGNFLNRQNDRAKTSSMAASQFLKKGKAPVIDVEAQCSKDVISVDSSIEELEILDDGREGRLVGSDHRSLETNVKVFVQDFQAKLPGYGPQASSSVVSDLTNLTQKVDDAGKMMESLSVSRGVEEVHMLPHKKLHERANRRDSLLSSLIFRTKIFESKWSFFSKRPEKKPAEDLLREPFTLLTPEEMAQVSRAFSVSNRRKILVNHENSNIEITGQILLCLKPGAWLNDEVINLYFELLKEREKREPNKFLTCHFFSTFFYNKLFSGRNSYDFKAVRRWTTQKKIGYSLVECDKIFVPVHKEVHWCLAVINKKDEKFQYLDSLKGMDTQVLNVLAKYFVDEVKDKSGKDIDVSSWKHEYVDDLPEQENGFDCGMFMIKYADFYSRGLGLCFKQENMPYFRLRTAKEILRLKAE